MTDDHEDEGMQKVDGVEDQQTMMMDSNKLPKKRLKTRCRSRAAVTDGSKSRHSKRVKVAKANDTGEYVEFPVFFSDDDEFQNAAPSVQVEQQEGDMGEVEKLQARIRELEKQADDKESEVAILKEKVEELTGSVESLEDLNQILIVKAHQHNDELQEARRVLIQEIGDSSNSQSFIGKNSADNDLEEVGESSNSHSTIGIKRMGELDTKPFGDALKDICGSSSTDHVSDQAVLLCNFWEQMLKDPLWHPFKISLVDGKHQELIDEEDRLLKGLKSSWGEEAYSAVVNALVELNEYAPSGRYPVQELWNFEENRRATAKEGIEALADRLKKYRPTNTTSKRILKQFKKY